MDPVLVAPPPPANAMTSATAGSFLITSTICRMELSIAGNDESCGPCTPPVIAPVSCVGKKPLGILTNNATLSRDRDKQDEERQNRMVQHPMQAALIERQQLGKRLFRWPGRCGHASWLRSSFKKIGAHHWCRGE